MLTAEGERLKSMMRELLAIVDIKPGSVKLAEPPDYTPSQEEITAACDRLEAVLGYQWPGDRHVLRRGMAEALRAARERA